MANDEFRLIKPTKYGDRITLEDYNQNLTDIENYINRYKTIQLDTISGVPITLDNVKLHLSGSTSAVLVDEKLIDQKIQNEVESDEWELIGDVDVKPYNVNIGQSYVGGSTGGGTTGGGTTTVVSSGIPWLADNYADLAEFGNKAKENEVVKYNINEDGSNNSEGFVLLVKTAGGIKQIKTWEEIESHINTTNTKIDGVEAKANKNIADITQLASEIQYIENTWTGTKTLGGLDVTRPSFDLKTISGDKGAFTFGADDKLIVRFEIDNTAFGEEKTLRVGIKSDFHIVGKRLDGGQTNDVTFSAAVGTDGILRVSDFHSTGDANWNVFHLRMKLVEQNPKVAAVIDAYTKAEADARFEPKVYDYSGADSVLTYNLTGGNRFQIIAMPTDADKTPIGFINKIKIAAPSDPTKIPQDSDQVTYGADLLWINKAATNIMNWSEIKTQVAAGKIMVIKKISDGNWELVRWEGGTSIKRGGIIPEHPHDLAWLTDNYAGVADFFNRAKDYEMVKYNSLPNGDPINIIIYAKTPTGIREFRCWEEVNKFVNGETNRLQKQIDINFQDIMENSKGITALEKSIGNKIQITSRVNGSDTISDTTKVLVKQPDGHVYLANPVVSEPDYIHLFNKVQDNEGKCDRNTLDIKHIKQMMADLNKKFAPLVYDFTAKAEMLTHDTAMGKEYARITEPADVEDAPIGAIIKVIPRIGVYAPASTDEMSFGTHMLFLNEKNNHVMTWADAQPHVENAETLVLKKTNKFIYELVRWEKESNAFRDINYGVASAGKYLKVDDHGWIVPVNAPILFKK